MGLPWKQKLKEENEKDNLSLLLSTTTTTTFIATVIHITTAILNIRLNGRGSYVFYKCQEHVQVM